MPHTVKQCVRYFASWRKSCHVMSCRACGEAEEQFTQESGGVRYLSEANAASTSPSRWSSGLN